MAEVHLNYGTTNCNGREIVRRYFQRCTGRWLSCKSLFSTLYRRLCRRTRASRMLVFDEQLKAASTEETSST
ncbi:hypothetical protein CEXT_334251 [Caerostris extrusa]|uniref:Uncharacterized protein n=1 Tax=Caerostris extrusa TaxID=172846 RepID=A0AAV4X778_CAEEX|nr:hypothetical protein CEXT_334251 [Caerostris extrusa]